MLKVQLDIETMVPREAINTARKFGVELGEQENDPQSYAIALLKQLLIQREKLDHGVLDKYLNPETSRWWKKFLSSLEERNRKLLKVETGSIIFTLFCPTDQSFQQLRSNSWRTRVGDNLRGFLGSLGNHRLILIPVF